MTNSSVKIDGLPATMEANKTQFPLRIAVVYSRNPFPMMRGDQLTVAHFIAYFSARGHQIDLFYTDVGGEQTPVQRDWLRERCHQIFVYRQSWIRKILGILSSAFRAEPVQVGYFKNSSMKSDVSLNIEDGSYDIIYCYYLRSANFVEGYERNKINARNKKKSAAFLAMQLSQTLNTKRIFQNSSNIFKKSFYYLEWKLMERYESQVWKKFTKTILIGPKDVEAVKEACRQREGELIDNWIYGAHGTDLKKFKPATPEEVIPGRIVFSGSMLYQPNVQAVLWFMENCWEDIKSSIPDATLYIVGRDPVDAIVRLAALSGVSVTGTVDDVSTYIRSANVCINPMLAAGGMQNKLVEYLASAKPVVATSIANEGVMAPSDSLIIADDPAAFVAAIKKIISSPDLALELSKNANMYVKKNWSWEAHFEILESNFINVLGKEI